jgi:uncharacterized membrane protein (DUF2068 family)
MKLKNATLFAIIGSLIFLCLRVYDAVINITMLTQLSAESLKVEYLIYSIIGIIRVVGWGLITPFFVVLYKNQKK